VSQAASQASSFYKDVARNRRLWAIKDEDGFPAPKSDEGRAMPFWSTRSRVERVIAKVPAYAGFSPIELTWEDFKGHWLPGLERDGLRVGVNWSGPRATGYDLLPSEVERNVEYWIEALSAG
jgi:hypothetical protein